MGGIGAVTQIVVDDTVGGSLRIYTREREDKKCVAIECIAEERDFTAIINCNNPAAVDRIISALTKARDEAFGGHDRVRRVNNRWRNASW